MTRKEQHALNAQFIESSLATLNEIKTISKQKCKEVLDQLGGSFSWDWENEDAPSLTSINFGDDLADCYITKVYFDENGNILADLHAYYLCCDDYEGVLLVDEPNTDWVDLLEYLNAQL